MRATATELCLTTAISRAGPVPDALHLYCTLRQHSPAPYAALPVLWQGWASGAVSGPHIATMSVRAT